MIRDVFNHTNLLHLAIILVNVKVKDFMIYHSLHSYIFDMFAVGDPHLLRKPLESHLNISGGNIVLLLRVIKSANFS